MFAPAAEFPKMPRWLALLVVLEILVEEHEDRLLVNSHETRVDTRVFSVGRCLDPALLRDAGKGSLEVAMQDRLTLPERILQLRKVDLFQDLPVNELAAVALVGAGQRQEAHRRFREVADWSFNSPEYALLRALARAQAEATAPAP